MPNFGPRKKKRGLRNPLGGKTSRGMLGNWLPYRMVPKEFLGGRLFGFKRMGQNREAPPVFFLWGGAKLGGPAPHVWTKTPGARKHKGKKTQLLKRPKRGSRRKLLEPLGTGGGFQHAFPGKKRPRRRGCSPIKTAVFVGEFFRGRENVLDKKNFGEKRPKKGETPNAPRIYGRGKQHLSSGGIIKAQNRGRQIIYGGEKTPIIFKSGGALNISAPL